MRLPVAATIAASVHLIALPAAAQPSPLETFAAYDPEGVGKISLAAWVEHDWKDALLKYDANHDGHVQRAEYVAKFCENVESGLHRGEPRCLRDAALLFAALDQDHDGELSRAEIGAQSENLFRENDRDHNGFITAQEIRETANGK